MVGMKADKCSLCGSQVALRRFAMTMDGEELRLAPTLCADHGDVFLLRVGQVLGGLASQVPEQSALAGSLEEALANAAELAPDSVVILDVVERWHGPRAPIVLRAAAELAAYGATTRDLGSVSALDSKIARLLPRTCPTCGKPATRHTYMNGQLTWACPEGCNP